MTEAQAGQTVKVHYKGTLEDGTVFDSSEGNDPLAFELGKGTVIPGFENAIEGMRVGETKTITIPPEEAYGERRDGMTTEVGRDQMPDDLDPEVGMILQVRTEQGNVSTVTICKVTDDTVTVDANHPLAGKPLTFELELVEVT